jgi:hypothetical protein
MRIKLKKGKQKELINLCKENKTWKQLAKKIDVSEGYLKNELQKEKTSLLYEKYKILCNILGKNFDRYILKKLDDNWGRSKGGKKSSKNIKKIIFPEVNEELAEVIGIILGDGHVSKFKKGMKIRCYFIRIAGNSKTDRDYLTSYIPLLFKRVFNEKGNLHFSKNSNVGYFTIYGKNFVGFLNRKGINSGNKKINNQGVPKWIKSNKVYLSKCIRGLIDTDGSIHYISKNNENLRINYTSHIPKLLDDVRESLVRLGFTPSKIISNRQIFLTSKKDVDNYIKDIGFGNTKNLNRLKVLKSNMPR